MRAGPHTGANYRHAAGFQPERDHEHRLAMDERRQQIDGAKTTVTDPQNYTITFRDDGTLSGKADCNTFAGTYTQEGGFFITAKPDVMAACGGAWLDQQVL